MDACSLDGLAVHAPLPAENADLASYFVGDIDTAAPRRSELVSDASQDLLLPDMDDGLDRNELMLPNPATALPARTAGPAACAPAPWESFPSIPEHSELQLGRAWQPALRDPAMHAQPGRLRTQPLFVPMPEGPGSSPYTSNSPISSIDPGFAAFSAGNSPASSSSDLAATEARGRFPRIASMPNLTSTSHHAAAAAGAGLPGSLGPGGGGAAAGSPRHDGGAARRRAAAGPRPRGMPRSRSTGDLGDLSRYVVPHSGFLTPPHLRKGKGGRQPAADPRADPHIDPKKARRILANRMSAAKSKLKQKSAADGLKQRLEMLRLQQEGLAADVSALSTSCAAREAEREALRQQLHAVQTCALLPGARGTEPELPPWTAAGGLMEGVSV